MASIYTYNILTPSATLGSDINLVNSYIETTNAPSVNIKQAVVSQYLDPITPVREQWVFTPTAASAVGQVYSFRLQQIVSGRNISKVFSYTSVTNADTRLAICTALARVVNLDPELSVVAAVTGSNPNETLTITASTAAPDVTISIISTGNGFTIPSTPSAFINSAGNAVTITPASAAANILTGATAGVNGTYALVLANSNLFDGMLVRYTLVSGDSFTLVDGTVINTVGATIDTRIGNVVSGTSFQVGVLHDSNLKSCTLSAGAVARTATPVVAPVRGTGAELASRGIVGAVAANLYGELKLNYMEVPPNGGAPISKTHSVFVNGGIPSTNLVSIYGSGITDMANVSAAGGFKVKATNAMRGATASAVAFNAISEPVSIG